MNYKILIFVLLLVTSCTKKVEKSILESPEYKDLVGTWTTDYPSDEVRKVVVEKKGKITIFTSTERGKKFYVTEFKNTKSALTFDGDTLMKRSLSGYKNGKSHGYLIFFKKPNSDTSFISLGQYIKNFEADTNYSILNKIYVKN